MLFFFWQRHDNKILKVQILLSRNFVVVAQAPILNLLEDAQQAIIQGKRDRDVSAMLKGVVANMHVLCRFSREAGFLPYIGHAHYLYECYLKSRINSSSPSSGCDLSTVWSLMVDLDKDWPTACSLALKPSL